MSDEQDALSAGLNTFATVLNDITESCIEIMRIHPVNGLIMMNLLNNIGYAIFAVPTEAGQYLVNQYGLFGGEQAVQVVRFDSRQELMAWIFRRSATHAGALLDTKIVGELFSAFNISKLVAALV